MIPANGGLPGKNKTAVAVVLKCLSAHDDIARSGGKTPQQLPQIPIEFGATGIRYRGMQTNDQITARQTRALTPENFARDALDQIAAIGALDQFFGNRHAQTGSIESVWAVVQRIEPPANGATKSKNG